MAGKENEFICAREDEIAGFITAIENCELFRRLYEILLKKGVLTDDEYKELIEALDHSIRLLRIGKSSTADLRNNWKLYQNEWVEVADCTDSCCQSRQGDVRKLLPL